MRNLAKLAVCTALLGSTVAADIAQARPWGPPRGYGRYHHYHRGGNSGLGNFLLGAGLVGAIAVIASNSNRDRDNDREVRTERYDPPPAPLPEPAYERPRDDYSNSSRYERDAAVDLCKVAAEREGEKYSSRVNIGAIEDVRMQREGGYRVTGIVDIDRAGYKSNRPSDSEKTRFDCTAAGGRVVAFKFGSSAELAQRY